MAQIILLGGNKNGSGKTTIAIHIAISLLKLGFSVASVDLDERQQSLSRYIGNRREFSKQFGGELLFPEHFEVSMNADDDTGTDIDTNNENIGELANLFQNKLAHYDFVIVDTPSNNTNVSIAAHSYADILITPVNDSFDEVGLLGNMSSRDFSTIAPGTYSSMLLSQKLKKAERDGRSINWIIARNRFGSLGVLGKRNIGFMFNRLSRKLGFRVILGFDNHTVFEELFLDGLTLVDQDIFNKMCAASSILSARQELRHFICALGIEKVVRALSRK